MTEYNVKLTMRNGGINYAVVSASSDEEAIKKSISVTPGEIEKTRIMSRIKSRPQSGLTWIAEDFNF